MDTGETRRLEGESIKEPMKNLKSESFRVMDASSQIKHAAGSQFANVD